MINRNDNPEFINSFLDYSATILNKSPNTNKRYFNRYYKENRAKWYTCFFKLYGCRIKK